MSRVAWVEIVLTRYYVSLVCVGLLVVITGLKSKMIVVRQGVYVGVVSQTKM